MHHTKITQKERELISQWKKEAVANKEIARRLSRPVLTIRRELKRNQTRVSVGKDWEIIYEPIHAQSVAMERKQNAWLSKQPLKSKKIYRYVMRHLRGGWSPEQISGRLREVDHKGEPDWQICMETIYQFVYKKKTDVTKLGLHQKSILDKTQISKEKSLITVTDYEQPLYEYLRRKQVRRRKRGGRKSQRIRIPDRVSIHDRPKIVAKRKQFGHWEGDSIVGLGHISGLHTEYERVASLIRFERLERITADQTAAAARKIFDPLPPHAKRSTTLDNGSEQVKHAEFGISATYFADTYASWQRGGNENGNLWIRYYFPKGTDFSTITDEELKDVEWELNNRPRKRLKFKTPQEVFSEYLTKP
jgi:IS30 family transposase